MVVGRRVERLRARSYVLKPFCRNHLYVGDSTGEQPSR